MEIDLDDRLGYGLFDSLVSTGVSGADLVAEVRKVARWAQEQMSSFSSPEKLPFDWMQRKEGLAQFIKPVPEGPLSVYCQSLWAEAENKLRKIDQQSGTKEEIDQGKKETLQDLEKQIGKAFLAYQCHPSETDVALNSIAPLKAVQDLYAQSIRELVSRVQSFVTYERSSNLTDLDLARSFRLSREIASTLVTTYGKLNLGIIPDIKSAFFSKTASLHPYEQVIARVLDRIGPSWQPLFDQISKPTDPAGSGAKMVRADLNLGAGAPVADIHAKQGALSAILSHHCQGLIGDCQSVSFSLNLQDEFLKNALIQYGDLIQNGSIQSANQKSDRFFFKTTLGSHLLQTPIEMDQDGKLIGGLSIWNAPNFKMALRQMGIEPVPHFKTAVLNQLGANLSPITTTVDQILKVYAQVGAQFVSGTNPETLLEAARYAYPVESRVLRAFEATLTSMSEEKRGNSVYSDLLLAIESPLQPVYEELSAMYTAGPVAQFKSVFEQTLRDKIRYVYNGAIQDMNSDEGGTKGGFELYQKHLYDPTKMGTRILTPQQFEELLLDTAEQSGQWIGTQALLTIAATVKKTISDGGYLESAFVAYDPANQMNSDPVANYTQLAHTPMTSQMGDPPVQADQIDAGLPFSPYLQSNPLSDAADLLKWTLGLASWKEKNQCSEPPSNQFLLTLGVDEIAQYVKGEQSFDEWKKGRFMQPGKGVSSWIVDLGTRLNYFQSMINLLKEEEPQVADSFEHEARALANTPMSLSQFSNSMAQVLSDLLPSDDPSRVDLVVDSLLMKALPKGIKSILESTAVRVASTHLNDEDKDIFVCVYYNPRTQSLSFGTMDENQTNLAPMDESQWLDANWEADVTNEPIASS